MRSIILACVFAIMMIATTSNEASAQQRCGTWMHNGTIHIGPSCSRQPSWQRNQHGQRYWGHNRPHGPAYYHSQPRRQYYAAPVMVPQRHYQYQQQYVPSPAQVAGSVQHYTTRQVAGCAEGYTQSADGWCHRTRWVPGP